LASSGSPAYRQHAEQVAGRDQGEEAEHQRRIQQVLADRARGQEHPQQAEHQQQHVGDCRERSQGDGQPRQALHSQVLGEYRGGHHQREIARMQASQAVARFLQSDHSACSHSLRVSRAKPSLS
jgi:hypothetical protein